MRIAFIGQKGIGIGKMGGGVETHVACLASALAGRGHEITVYTRPKYGAPRVPVAGIEARSVPTVYRKNLEAIVHAFLCTLDAMGRSSDVIHYHGVGPATVSILPRLLTPWKRVVVTFHSQDRFHAKWGRIARAYLHLGEWAACRFPHATITVSHVLQVYVRYVYARQAVYIPNGADVQVTPSDERVRAFGLEPGRYLLNVSRLVPHKGQHVLIEAYRALKRAGKHAGLKLAIVGEPSYTPGYEERLHKLAEGDPDILFLGFRAGEELRQLFGHAYAYIQPSEAEGLPVVVLEAMSFGIPVVVSDIPENVEAIHGVGFTFRRADARDLTRVLGDLAQDKARVHAVAERTRDVVKAEFSWGSIADHTEAVYRSIRH